MSTHSHAQALVNRLIEGSHPNDEYDASGVEHKSGLTPSERKTLARVEAILVKDGKLDDAAFDTLFDIFAEGMAEDNRPGRGDDDAASFDESTLKHQVFDYLPNEFYKLRRQDGIWAGINDLAMAMAVLLPFELVDEQLREHGL